MEEAIVPAASVQRDSSRLLVSSSLAAMQMEIGALAGVDWVDHVNQRVYTGGWDVLPLRCQHQYLNAHSILQSFSVEAGDDWADLPVMQSLPSVSRFLQRLRCPIRSVRLMRLRAGAEIRPHRDRGLGMAFGEARLHLPVQTSDDVVFTVNRNRIPMQAGELWYIDADQEHAVRNLGSQDRINLVIDCLVNEWLGAKIMEGVAS